MWETNKHTITMRWIIYPSPSFPAYSCISSDQYISNVRTSVYCRAEVDSCGKGNCQAPQSIAIGCQGTAVNDCKQQHKNDKIPKILYLHLTFTMRRVPRPRVCLQACSWCNTKEVVANIAAVSHYTGISCGSVRHNKGSRVWRQVWYSTVNHWLKIKQWIFMLCTCIAWR